MTDQNAAADHGHRVIPIFIDNTKYDAPDDHMTGTQLRALPKPPVAAERDLWLEIPGPKDDELIEPTKKYEVKPGSHYYTAPKTLNPGAYSYAVTGER
jgi:hypothetical protein